MTPDLLSRELTRLRRENQQLRSRLRAIKVYASLRPPQKLRTAVQAGRTGSGADIVSCMTNVCPLVSVAAHVGGTADVVREG